MDDTKSLPLGDSDTGNKIIFKYGNAEYSIPYPIWAKDMLMNKPPLPPDIIKGILRQGAKMSVTARSKAGKSFLMLELACAIASGTEWLGHKCEKGKVLYINTELQEAEIADRYEKVKNALGITEDIDDKIMFWHLRGYAEPLAVYVDAISEKVNTNNIQMVIIDPIYKLMQGSENDQAVVTAFCNSVDAICKSGAACGYVHHHRKGSLGDNDAQDRGSGSGVFARDADAMIDIIQVFNPGEGSIDPFKSSVTAWRVSYVLRSFPSPNDRTILFDYPIHRLDLDGLAQNAKPKTAQSKAGKASGEKSSNKKAERIDQTRKLLDKNPGISIKDAAEIIGVGAKTMRAYFDEIGITEGK